MNQLPVIRAATIADLAAINSIFNFYVANSTCIWTSNPCTDAERLAWFKQHTAKMPILVAELGGQVVGWASLSTFRDAYTQAGTLEDSIYVHTDFRRRGIGRLLLTELISRARELGLRSILANISSDQTPSIQLHEKFGFQKVAHLREVGLKFGQHFDAVYYQLRLF